MSYNLYHWCLVSECKNTSVKTPQKLWIQVPSDIKMRNTWLKLARRDPKSLSTKTRLYLCEDHFDLENDMENYTQYKIMGSVKRIQMKKKCIPSRFDCQANKKHKSTSSESRHAFIKKQRMSTIKLIKDIEETIQNENNAISLPSCSQDSNNDALEPDVRHVLKQYKCNACGGPIEGFRYACVQCADYDQCAECEASGAHAEHYVLRVPRVERAAELQTVLDRIRRELMQITIPVKMEKEEEEEAEEGILVVTEPAELTGVVDPLQYAGVGAVGVGGGVVKQEVIDSEDSDTTTRGQVPVTDPSLTDESSIEAGAGEASRPEVVDQFTEMLWVEAGVGTVKQEAFDTDEDLLECTKHKDNLELNEALPPELVIPSRLSARISEPSNSNSRTPASSPPPTVVPDTCLNKTTRLYEILNQDCHGKTVINIYSKNKRDLIPKARNILTRCIVKYECDKAAAELRPGQQLNNFIISTERFDFWSNQIVLTFRGERADTYFTQYPSVDDYAVNTTGKLWKHYNYIKSKLKNRVGQ